MTSQRDVRDAVSIAALCEVAEESAFPGDLDELRAQLVALRITESPDGIDEAEDAARALQHVIGAPPHLASPARLDAIGQAVRRLELALDPAVPSPFTAAMRGATEVADALLGRRRGRLQGRARLPLRHGRRWLLPVRRRPGGDPPRAPRVRRAAGRGRQGRAARAVRDADPLDGRRADAGGARAGGAVGDGRRAGARSCATRCACCSRRRSRSSPPPARASCANRSRPVRGRATARCARPRWRCRDTPRGSARTRRWRGRVRRRAASSRRPRA